MKSIRRYSVRPILLAINLIALPINEISHEKDLEGRVPSDVYAHLNLVRMGLENLHASIDRLRTNLSIFQPEFWNRAQSFSSTYFDSLPL